MEKEGLKKRFVLMPPGIIVFSCATALLVLAVIPAWAAGTLREEFIQPAEKLQSRPLWFWNGPLDADKTRKILQECKASGYAGVGILPARGMTPAFMSPEFLDHYKVAVEEAAKLGVKCCLYDEYWFPSGSAGGLLAKKFPEALGKRLEMTAIDVTGPKECVQEVPAGTFLGAVAMDLDTKKRIDLSGAVKDGRLVWNVPAGNWKVMSFACVRDGGGGLVDYHCCPK